MTVKSLVLDDVNDLQQVYDLIRKCFETNSEWWRCVFWRVDVAAPRITLIMERA